MAFVETNEDESLPQLPLIVVIYAEPGSGKTSLSFTSDKPLLFDFDKGARRCIGRKKTVNFDCWADVEEYVNKGHLDKDIPNTLILDTGGTMLDDFIGGHVMRMDSQNRQKSGALSQKGFGAMKDVFNNFTMSELRSRSIDIVILCHIVESDDNGRKVLRPKMTGGAKDILIAKADLLGYMYIDNGKRILNFNPTDRHIGKNCAKFPLIEIKDQETDPSASTQLADIIKKAKDHMSKMSDLQMKALEFIEDYKCKLDKCETIEDIEIFNDLMPEDLSSVYQVQIDKLTVDKYNDIWTKTNIDPAKTVEDFNNLINLKKDVTKRNNREITTRIANKAAALGYKLNKEKEFFNPNAEIPSEKETPAIHEDQNGEKEITLHSKP